MVREKVLKEAVDEFNDYKLWVTSAAGTERRDRMGRKKDG